MTCWPPQSCREREREGGHMHLTQYNHTYTQSYIYPLYTHVDVSQWTLKTTDYIITCTSSIPRYLVYSKISRLFQDTSSIPRYMYSLPSKHTCGCVLVATQNHGLYIYIYSLWFSPGTKNCSSERVSQGEQNGANFSSIAPSSEKLL